MMMSIEVEQLWTELQQTDENVRIEAKRASEIGASIMQTICAFANEIGLGGGYLLLGVHEPDAQHSHYWLDHIENSDELLNTLQINCREQFEYPISIQAKCTLLENKKIIVVFVPELEPSAKPCTFKGKFDSKNKRKTGVWRRGVNGDYECSQYELEPILLAKTGLNYEQVVLPYVEYEDLDPNIIQLYRSLREKINPSAEELQASNIDMLKALNLINKKNEKWLPNVAGLLLMGKTLSLRRLLPAMRADYVRVSGTQWVENPEQRFMTTLDLREPLLRLIPKLEATIMDDLPRHFQLNEGEIQRSDWPLLPRKVVREAVVNALMHRDYQVNQPILAVRYSNRLEIRNAGYSLKPEVEMGEMGSVLRNPIIASVLYDLGFAETKGSGIRTMRRLLEQAGLSAPVFNSQILSNQFHATYLLHQLMGEEQLNWLKQFKDEELTVDEAKALVLAYELDAVDNSGLRAITGLDTLSTSQTLAKLCYQRQMLKKYGAGVATYYQLAEHIRPTKQNPADSKANMSDPKTNMSDLKTNMSDLKTNMSDLPHALQYRIEQLGLRPRTEKLQVVILWLCHLHAYRADKLAKLLERQMAGLKSLHLSRLRKEGYLNYLYPEIIHHPEQAYQTTENGKQWLIQQGIEIEG